MSGTGKHILFIPRWYPSDIDPMLGLFVKNHALAALASGYRVTVAYPVSIKAKIHNRHNITVTTEGNLTEVIAFYPDQGILKGLLLLIAWFKCIRLAVKINGRPHLVHAHVLTRAGLIAWLTAGIYGISYIITEHWSRYFPDNMSYKGSVRKKLTAFIVKNASLCTVVSKRLYNAMQQQGLSFPLRILPNVVDTTLFKVRDQKSAKFRFISITCFEDKSKNLKMLIAGAIKLRSLGFDFELMLVGDGADRNMIQEYCISEGFEAIFTGTLTPAETATLLGESHCLVLTSNYETFGIVAFESLASGVPVIATDVADLSEIIDGETGIIIPRNNTDSLVDAMKILYTDYKKYSPEYLRAKVIDKCSIKAVSGILGDYYQQAISKP